MERNTRIRASQLANILPSDITASATNSPSDGQVPSKATGTDEWTWIDAGGGGISNVVEDTTPQLGGDLDLNGKNIDFPSVSNISDCLDEDDMASDSATSLATQQSIKKYVDDNAGGMKFIASEVFSSEATKTISGLSGTKIYMLVISLKADLSATVPLIRFNGDTSTNYKGGMGWYLSSSLDGQDFVVSNGIPLYASTISSGSVFTSIIWIQPKGSSGYSSNHYVLHGWGRSDENVNLALGFWLGGEWQGSSSLSSITVYTGSGRTCDGKIALYEVCDFSL
ncbi:MAG: hypothetical protein JW924_03410 [Fusobacteriaceae bacterium]|nr:hypothetical protein [Fusobacteriaceae bacterium]